MKNLLLVVLCVNLLSCTMQPVKETSISSETVDSTKPKTVDEEEVDYELMDTSFVFINDDTIKDIDLVIVNCGPESCGINICVYDTLTKDYVGVVSIHGYGYSATDLIFNHYRILEGGAKGTTGNIYTVYAYLDSTYELIKELKVHYFLNGFSEDNLPPSALEEKYIEYNRDTDNVVLFRKRWEDVPFKPIWHEYQKKKELK